MATVWKYLQFGSSFSKKTPLGVCPNVGAKESFNDPMWLENPTYSVPTGTIPVLPGPSRTILSLSSLLSSSSCNYLVYCLTPDPYSRNMGRGGSAKILKHQNQWTTPGHKQNDATSSIYLFPVQTFEEISIQPLNDPISKLTEWRNLSGFTLRRK